MERQRPDLLERQPREFGNFSTTIITWGTTFSKDDDNAISPVFQAMLANRPIISQRLGAEDPNSLPSNDSEYWYGYDTTHQDVVINAFLSAYTGSDR